MEFFRKQSNRCDQSSKNKKKHSWKLFFFSVVVGNKGEDLAYTINLF